MAKFVEVRENAAEINEINKAAAAELAASGINVTPEQTVGTIAYVFLKNAIKVVADKAHATGEDVELNMFQLFDIGITHRENEESEKDGNKTPYLRPGQQMKLIIKSDDDTEE